MKKSILLQLAKERLEQRKTKYVCTALRETGDSLRYDHTTNCVRLANDLRDWVMQDLLGRRFSSYEGWLEAIHPDLAALDRDAPKIQIGPNTTSAEMITARLAWMGWMIQYWQAKGD
jgi:hypothetical protein